MNNIDTAKTAKVAVDVVTIGGKIVAKSAAETAAAFVLLAAVGYTVNAVQERKARRAAKKAATEE
jgi:hypothetical protein